MKLGGAVVLWTSITILYFRWVNRSDREDAADRRAARAAVVVLCLATLTACGRGGATVEGRVVIGEPVSGDRAALYLTLRGGGGDRFVGLDVEGVEHSSLHMTTQVEGMFRMEPVPGGFEVGSGETLRLRPGGAHAMLEGIAGELMPGDSVRATLHFDSGSVEVWAHVVALADLEAALGR
jgi:copper(I)-binding protein